MDYEKIPGVFHEKQDGGLTILTTSNAPRVLVIGTASSGDAETPYVVGRTQEAAVEFGSGGTLTRGMYEVKTAGAENVILFRVGSTPAVLEGIGVDADSGGVTITTSSKDDSASSDYSFYWDNTSSAQRLVVMNVDSEAVIFDRDFSEPTPTIDLGEVYVSGSPTDGEGDDIGDQYTFLTLAEAAAADPTGLTLTEGTDGTSPSRMKMYENLFMGYKLLENEKFDFVVPMDVYLDDANAADGDTYAASPGTEYPAMNSADDILLYFYAEEYEGDWYFWWRENKTTGNPDIYPTGYATTSPSGVDLATTAFNEVNFGYQLANFCYQTSRNFVECHGVIGVKPPLSTSLKDVSNWVGKLPTYTVNEAGDSIISGIGHNGSGLLGNKFMAGKYGFRASVAYGGFIATDEEFLDGTEQTDRGGELIDIGQYLSVCAAWVGLFNRFDTSGLGYITTLAPTYAGFASVRDPKSAPTNKKIGNVRLPFRLNNQKINDLTGLRYVTCQEKPKGTVVVDAPTAARPTSDYRRLTTVRIVKLIMDDIRNVCDPFVGNVGGSIQLAALDTAIRSKLRDRAKDGYLERSDFSITQTLAEKVNGDCTIELMLVTVFELRRITVVMSLNPV